MIGAPWLIKPLSMIVGLPICPPINDDSPRREISLSIGMECTDSIGAMDPMCPIDPIELIDGRCPIDPIELMDGRCPIDPIDGMLLIGRYEALMLGSWIVWTV